MKLCSILINDQALAYFHVGIISVPLFYYSHQMITYAFDLSPTQTLFFAKHLCGKNVSVLNSYNIAILIVNSFIVLAIIVTKNEKIAHACLANAFLIHNYENTQKKT